MRCFDDWRKVIVIIWLRNDISLKVLDERSMKCFYKLYGFARWCNDYIVMSISWFTRVMTWIYDVMIQVMIVYKFKFVNMIMNMAWSMKQKWGSALGDDWVWSHYRWASLCIMETGFWLQWWLSGLMMSAKYCIFNLSRLVFVRLLVLLIFNVFACLSVLLSCRSLHLKCC